MRKLRLILVLFLASQAFAAVAHTKSGQGFCTGSTSSGAISGTCASTSTKTFSYTPFATGGVVLIGIATNAASSVTTASLSLAGWSFNTCSSGAGASGSRMAYFWAYAPSTSAASITMTWTVATPSSTPFMNVLIEEFSGMDATTAVSACAASSGSGAPTASITPASNNNMIALLCDDSITAVGNIDGVAATKGADDTQQDWGEYRLLTGGSGVSKTAAFTGSGAYTCGIFAVQPPSGAVTKICTLSLMGAGPC